MKSVFKLLTLGIFVCFSQVNMSDDFQRILKKILNEQVKTEIISFVDKQDPTLGLISRDLIGQLIDNSKHDEIIRSSVNVFTTMLYLLHIQPDIEALIEKYPSVLQDAKEFGWGKKELLSYSSLYFYYSERIKYNLFISPYIFDLKKVKEGVESFKISNNTKWTTTVSRELKKIGRKRLTYDGVMLEYIQNMLTNAILGNSNKALLEDVITRIEKKKWLRITVTSEQKALIELLEHYLKKIDRHSQDKDLYHYLINPFIANLHAVNYQTDIKFAQKQLLQQLKQLLTIWINKATESNVWAYDLTLSGNQSGESVQFTLFDMLKVNYKMNSVNAFLFTGGFVDSFLKETLNSGKTSNVHLGAGFNYKNISLSYSKAWNIKAFKEKPIDVFSLGYTIPLNYLFE